LITLATYGIGMLVGFYIAGIITDTYSSNGQFDYKMIWIIPAAIAFGVMVLFLLFFKDDKKKRVSAAETEKGLAASPVS
jgi:MFS family permease